MANFRQVGKELSGRMMGAWRDQSAGQATNAIKMHDELISLAALLAAILEEVENVRLEIRLCQRFQIKALNQYNEQKTQPADGILHVMHESVWQNRLSLDAPDSVLDLPIDLENAFESVNVRARKALVRSGAKTLRDIEPERFRNLVNCGRTTIRELMAWKDRWISEYLAEHPEPKGGAT